MQPQVLLQISNFPNTAAGEKKPNWRVCATVGQARKIHLLRRRETAAPRAPGMRQPGVLLSILAIRETVE